MIFFHKEHLEELRVINVAPACTTQVHRLESLCHQPKMNFASVSFRIPFISPAAPEDGGAYPHQGGAFLHRHGEIAGHAHGELRQGQTGEPPQVVS